MSEPLLETRDLLVDIGNTTVVSGLQLRVANGERLAILGRNGSGKSTLLATLAGLRRASGGTILLAGEDLARMPARRAALQRAWLGQSQNDPFASTVLETVLTGRHPHLRRWDWESRRDADLARSALRAVGLSSLEQRQIGTLSGGERQRLAIATVLTQAPALYLLDEPLSHLDLNHQMAVLELFAGATRERAAAVLMVLHDPALAHRFCDRALLLFGDGYSEIGPVDGVLTGAILSELYGHALRQIDDDGRRFFVPQ